MFNHSPKDELFKKVTNYHSMRPRVNLFVVMALVWLIYILMGG
jgi:hypothetical protein